MQFWICANIQRDWLDRSCCFSLVLL